MASAPTGALLSECLFSRGSCLWPYPVGKDGAPSCWPGASTWQTAKCWVISCMSSKLKNALKQDLSVKSKTHISHKLFISPHFSFIQSIPYHRPLLFPFNHYFTKMKYLNNLSDSSCPKGWLSDISTAWKEHLISPQFYRTSTEWKPILVFHKTILYP